MKLTVPFHRALCGEVTAGNPSARRHGLGAAFPLVKPRPMESVDVAYVCVLDYPALSWILKPASPQLLEPRMEVGALLPALVVEKRLFSHRDGVYLRHFASHLFPHHFYLLWHLVHDCCLKIERRIIFITRTIIRTIFLNKLYNVLEIRCCYPATGIIHGQ